MEKQEKINILRDVIRIKSVNGNEEEVSTYLQNLLKQHGIKSNLIKFAEGRSNLVAELNNKPGKILGFSGHMDVVDPGDTSQWIYPPFDAHIEGTKLYGRGSTDMKSGLVAMTLAMIELKEKNSPFSGTLRLLATVGEEVGELGAGQLTKRGYVDDLDALIIGEPTGYNLVYTHMGSINYTVTSYGKEAHSSMPNEGINAINHLADFISVINTEMGKITETYDNKELGRTIHNVTVIDGGNQVNSIPGEAKLKGNIRSIPEYDNEKIIQLIQRILYTLNKKTNYKLKLVIDYNKMPVESNKDSDLIKSIQSLSSNKMPLIGISATTDVAEFIKSTKEFDFVIFGPGEPTLPHQINEYVSVDNYLDMIDRYVNIVEKYLS